MSDPWHFSRTELARSYLKSISIGNPRLALFAPRRRGKTEFLLQDLGPEAQRQKYRTVYVSCWENIDAPHLAIIAALEKAVAALRGKRSSMRAVLTAEVKRLRIDGLFNMVGGEIEFATQPQASTPNDQQRISTLLEELAAGKRTKVLLMIDEAQHLSTREEFDAIQHNLRSQVEKLGNVSVVFTGSSRHGIAAMFDDKNAPFYDWADWARFPDLDEDFIVFQSGVFEKVTKRKLDRQPLMKAFKDFDKNPFYFRSLLKAMALDPGLSVQDAQQMVLEALAARRDYASIWHGLKRLEQSVFLGVLQDKSLYSKEAMASYGKGTKKHAVQYALRRLGDMQLITKTGRTNYEIEVPGFVAWLKAQGIVT